ncbi:MAG TPA: hypothetical protein EYP30_01735 [Archaeoglobaceae archaeon]|nr:hypothetical protein [Archaeoglobaceae archaeon]
MYTEEGPSGIVHGYFSQQYPFEVFSTYTRILSDLYTRCSRKLKEPYRSAAYILRILPPEKAFHYYQNGGYTGLSAHSPEEFYETLEILNNGSFRFHSSGKDFIRWLKYEIGDNILSEMFNNMERKKGCVDAVRRRCEELWRLFE